MDWLFSHNLILAWFFLVVHIHSALMRQVSLIILILGTAVMYHGRVVDYIVKIL